MNFYLVLCFLFTFIEATAVLPCSGTPPSLGEVNLSRDEMPKSAPLWIEVQSTYQESYPFIVTNQRTNQPISYNVVLVHKNPGVFPSIYFKLEPHLGEWGEEGDFLTVGVDENAPNGWVILPPELPEVELNTAMDINEVIALPDMWPEEEISITQRPADSCYPNGSWRIYFPFQVYSDIVLWGTLEAFTDNQEGPVYMRSVFGHQLAATDGARYSFVTTEDPGRCVRVVPTNVAGTQFEALEFCLPQEEVVDAGSSFADAGHQSATIDSGPSDFTDAGLAVAIDGGSGGAILDSGASDGAGTTTPSNNDGGVDSSDPINKGCGCAQSQSKGFLHLGWLVLAFLTRRRFRGRT